MERQNRDYRHPIRVTGETLLQIASIVAQVQERARSRYLTSCNIQESHVNDFIAGNNVAGFSEYAARDIIRELQSIKSASYSVRFADGSSIHVSEIAEIEDALKSRSSCPERFSVTAGSYRYLDMDISIRQSIFTSAEWSISGERADVRDVNKTLEDIMENSEPEFPILHHRWRWGFAYGGSIVLMILLFVIFVNVLPLSPAGKSSAINSLSLIFFIIPMIGMAFSEIASRAYPLVEFAYGRSARRSGALRKLAFQILSLILIPAAMAAAPSLWARIPQENVAVPSR